MTRWLLADDDNSNRVTLAVLLEDEGKEVDVASSFAEARDSLTSGTTYDLVLLDQHLGDGLGTDLVPIVRKHHPGARIVLISGSLAAEELGITSVDAVVPKGTEFPLMLARLEDVLKTKVS